MAELFVALRCEELPAGMVRPALNGLRDGLLGLLKGIEHGDWSAWATPRRLAVSIEGVAEGKPLVEKLVTGPPADRAFVDGQPTRAAMGFARGKGVDVSDLQIVDTDRGKVVAVKVTEGGERTLDVIAAGLEAVVLGIPFKKSMEWGEGGPRFGRPLHEVCAVFDSEVVPGAVAGLRVSNSTVGHRLDNLGSFRFHSSREWVEGLRERHVEPDLIERKRRIAALLVEASERLDAEMIDDPELLEEVTHLVEWPCLVVGTFDEALLALPARLLIESMKSHQRYFPVHRDGQLTNRFVVITNNPWGDAALIADGNARVLRARFHDARFFYAEDQHKRLEEHGEQLERMRWIRGLGTMADKQRRISELAYRLGGLVGDADAARRAGALCKCDLATQMVGEFPSLQGHMGRLYALAQGEPLPVAVAIEDHYRPAGAGDTPPKGKAGTAVALADRLDTLVGCFGVGITPSGSGDPQGLRRAASGVLAIVEAHGLRVELGDLFHGALDVFDAHAKDYERWKPGEGLIDELVAFTLTRFKASAVSDGATPDLVDAVIEVTEPDAIVLGRKVKALRALAASDEYEVVLQTFKRVLNITRGAEASAADGLEHPAEKALSAAVASARGEVDDAAAALEYEAALDAMLGLRQPVAAFFDAVLVDDPDPAVKARRMGLLLDVAGVFRTLADFSRISTR